MSDPVREAAIWIDTIRDCPEHLTIVSGRAEQAFDALRAALSAPNQESQNGSTGIHELAVVDVGSCGSAGSDRGRHNLAVTPSASDRERALRAALSAPADDWHLDKFEQAVSLLGDTQPSASDLYHDLNGLVPMSPGDRAEFVMKQMLDGMFIGDGNREQVKEYLARHFRYLQEVQPSASDRERAKALYFGSATITDFMEG